MSLLDRLLPSLAAPQEAVMIISGARDSVTPDRIPHGGIDEPVVGSGRDLALQLWRPTSTSVVVHIAGELDASTAPRLQELLAPRLASMAATVILDLSGLRFLGVDGLELLAHAHRCGAHRAMTLCLVDGPVCVDRALHAAGWSDTISTYATVAATLAALTGRIRESTVHAAR